MKVNNKIKSVWFNIHSSAALHLNTSRILFKTNLISCISTGVAPCVSVMTVDQKWQNTGKQICLKNTHDLAEKCWAIPHIFQQRGDGFFWSLEAQAFRLLGQDFPRWLMTSAHLIICTLFQVLELFLFCSYISFLNHHR